MPEKFGTLVFKKNSWGRNELFTTFGFGGSSKATLNQVDSAKELLNHMKSQQGWVYLGDALDELLLLSESMSPTDSFKVVNGHLMVFWNKYNGLTRDTAPNECHMLQGIVTAVKSDFESLGTVGRNKLRESILTHALNMFETI